MNSEQLRRQMINNHGNYKTEHALKCEMTVQPDTTSDKIVQGKKSEIIKLV